MSSGRNNTNIEESQSLLRRGKDLIEEEQLEDVNLHTLSTNEPVNISLLLSGSNSNHSSFHTPTPSSLSRSFYLGGDVKTLNREQSPEAITPTVQPAPTTTNNSDRRDRNSLSNSSLFSNEQNMKLITPPMAFSYYPGGIGSDDGDEDDVIQALQHRESSLFLNRVVSYAISFALLCSLIAVIVIYVNFHHTKRGSDDDVVSSCYAAPSCPAEFISPQYDVVTGFTNFTGWHSSAAPYQCCNICPPTASYSASHSASAPASASLPQRDSQQRLREVNFDYLVFDQIWLPQFCHALDIGHDPTLSHLTSDRCQSYVYESFAPQLVIHGLWPNRLVDSLLCCNAPSTDSVPTLDLAEVQTWSFYSDLMTQWFDPTVSGSYFNDTLQQDIDCSYCYLLNHEWQKHGSCFGFSVDDVNQKQYFESGLVLAQVLATASAQINAFNGTVVTKAEIQALYAPYSVNVMCDPQDSYTASSSTSLRQRQRGGSKSEKEVALEEVGVLLEIQSCWDIVLPTVSTGRRFSDEPIRGSNFTMINCPAVRNSAYSSECPDQIYVRNFD